MAKVTNDSSRSSRQTVALKLIGGFVKSKISEKNLTIKTLEHRCKFQKQGVISRVVNARQHITPDIAARLSKQLGATPNFWLGLESKILELEEGFSIEYQPSDSIDQRMSEINEVMNDEFKKAKDIPRGNASENSTVTFKHADGREVVVNGNIDPSTLLRMFEMWNNGNCQMLEGSPRAEI